MRRISEWDAKKADTVAQPNSTPFDRYVRGEETALSQSARRGYLIFRDKANCISCHSGPDFTDGSFRSTGIGWDGNAYKDLGRGKITGKKSDNGRFRVPTLRELVWTAPYMHDGRMRTLEDVVEHYNRGGTRVKSVDSKRTLSRSDVFNSNLPTRAPTDVGRKLDLTEQEKKDLVAFLKSLSFGWEQPAHVKRKPKSKRKK